jgi:hypothetical protein
MTDPSHPVVRAHRRLSGIDELNKAYWHDPAGMGPDVPILLAADLPLARPTGAEGAPIAIAGE